MTYPQFESFPPTATKKISSTVFTAETRDATLTWREFRSRECSRRELSRFRAHSFLQRLISIRTFPASEITYFSFVVLRSILLVHKNTSLVRRPQYPQKRCRPAAIADEICVGGTFLKVSSERTQPSEGANNASNRPGDQLKRRM